MSEATCAAQNHDHANPPNLRAATDERACATCTYWSPWMPNTGDCMAYALKRRDAMMKAEGDEWQAAWPQKFARDTDAAQVCDDYKETANGH